MHPRESRDCRGFQWIAKNQGDNGSWPGQSVNVSDAQNKMFMTDAGTAYAVLALTQCAGL